MNKLELGLNSYSFGERIQEIQDSPELANKEDNLDFIELKKKAQTLGAKLGTGVPGMDVQNANSVFDSLVLIANTLTEAEKQERDIYDADLYGPDVEDKSTEKINELKDEQKEFEKTVLDEILTNIVNEKYEDSFPSKKQIIDQLKNAYQLDISDATLENADELLEIAIYEADKKESNKESEEKELILQ